MRGFDHISGKYFKIEDAEIYCETIGDENHPVLLFLHGALGNMEDFNGLISALPNQFRIIGIDSRGHGKSTLGQKQLTYEVLQNEIEIILKQLNVNDLNLIGFSNGGTIAYRLAAFTHLNIHKLITIGAPWSTKHLEHLLEPYSKLTSAIWKEQCPSDFESYHRLNPKPDFDSLFNQVVRMALDKELTGRPNESVQKIACPALIVRGEKDPIVSSSAIRELTQLVRNTHLLTIPRAGHEAFQNQPEIFISQLKKFLI